jgi:hypothetical protein
LRPNSCDKRKITLHQSVPQRQLDHGNEGKTQADVAPLVPPGGLFELGYCLWGETDPVAHPASSFASL